MMVMTKKELCAKIETIYPEIGQCGIEVYVKWDEVKNARPGRPGLSC